MTFWTLFVLSIKRLRSRISLALLFTLSASLAVGLLVCVPVFSDAVSQRIMKEELLAKTRWIGQAVFAARFYALPNATYPVSIEDAVNHREWIAHLLHTNVGLPVKSTYIQVESPTYHLLPLEGDSRYREESLGSARIVYANEIGDHIRIKSGAPFGTPSDNALSVWILEEQAIALAIQIGDTFELAEVGPRTGEPFLIKVVGFWEPLDTQDLFWYRDPYIHFESSFLTTAELYEAHVYPRVPGKTGFTFWYFVLDDASLNLNHAEKYIAGLENVAREVGKRLPRGTMDYSPISELAAGHQRKIGLSIVLISFSVPLFGILIHFIASISSMLAQFQEQEIAILTSRGATRLQILGLVLMETALMLLFAIPIGIAIGMSLAHLLGYSLSFLSFTYREPLTVKLVAVDWRLVAAALLVAIAARLVATWRASRFTMVLYERRMARQSVALNMAWYLFIGMLILVNYYAYQQLARQGSLGLISWQLGSPTNDPLLLLAPTLFLFTAPLLATEIFALLVRPLVWIGRALPSFSGYLSFLNLGREGIQYRTPVYMLVLALGLGIFYASLAKSADIWLVDRRRYEIGADFVFRFPTEEEIEAGVAPFSGQISLVPLEEYQKIPGVEQVTPIGEYKAIHKESDARVRLIGIDRLTFPQVAYFRPDYAGVSLGELMNRLGNTFNGILLPSEVAESLQISEGDRISFSIIYNVETRIPIEFTLVGTFDYFPTMYPDTHPVALANLDFLEIESAGLLTPTGLWLRTAPNVSKEQIIEGFIQLKVFPMDARDLSALLEYDRHRLERVGVFGMLSVAFLAGALLSGLGLLVYTFASMMRRALRFAVLQAIGAKKGEVIAIVSIEYLVTLLYGIVMGALVGVVSAYLYVPFFPLTEATGLPIPPFIPYVDWNGARLMTIGMIITLVLIEIAVLWRVFQTRIFEALRLGMRE